MKQHYRAIFFLVVVLIACSFCSEVLFPTPNICDPKLFTYSEQRDLKDIQPIRKNIELVGHLGGATEAVFAQDSFAYVKIGAEVAVLDISNPTQPVRIGSVILPGKLLDVDFKRHYAYILRDDGLWQINLSKPTDLKAIHLYNPRRHVQEVWITESHAYLHIELCERYFRYLPFQKCGSGLHVVDISTSTFSPAPADCYHTFGKLVTLLFTWNLSTPSPKKAVVGEYVYIAAGTEGLKVLDISNSTEVGSYTAPISPLQVVVANNYAYIAELNGGLRVVDTNNPAFPVEVGFYGTQERLEKVAVLGRRVYSGKLSEKTDFQADGLNSAFFTQVDFYKSLQTVHLGDAVVTDRYAYVITFSEAYESSSLHIVDVSNPTNPVQIGIYPGPGLIYGVEVAGNYAYIISRQELPSVYKMSVLDISNPSTPTTIGVYPMPDIPMELAIADNYAYIGDWDGDFYILNVSNPNIPVLVGTYKLQGQASEIIIMNTYAYIAVTNFGLQILDISNATVPTEVGFFEALEYTASFEVTDQYIYLADYENGFFILRFTPPGM
jgi:hypothetical protein